MDRFKSPRIETDTYMLNAMVYIDLNQYRVKKVEHPSENKWSSYHYYAYGKVDPLITPAPSYLGLGRTPEERQKVYRGMVEALLTNREKQNVSSTYFIGDPSWVIERYQEFRILLREKYAKWQKRDSSGPPR